MPDHAPRTDLYRSPHDAPRAPIGRGAAALLDPLRDRVDVLTAKETLALAAAGAWGTLDELSARAAQSGAFESRAEALAIFKDLASRGVLASEAELVAHLTTSANDDAERPRIATIGIPTRGRPDALRRAIETFGRDVAESGRDIDLLVVDETATEPASAGAAREAERRLGVRVRYADRHAAARFADAIAAESGALLDVVRRALLPEAGGAFAGGAGRNLLLLDSAGRCSLQADDDTVCALRRPPASHAGLALRSFEDPTEMWFDAAALSGGEELRGYAELHERLLGRTAASLVAASKIEARVDLARASTALLTRIAAGGRVACTQLGVRGDSAIGAMGMLLTLSRPTRDRLLASERDYRRAITSRRLARAVTADTLTDQELCMTLAIGLDGRAPLPPFPPLDRNEDGLFGCVLATCEPSAVFGHLPVTLAHEPVDARQAPFDQIFDQAARVGINDLVAGLVSASRAEVDTRSPSAAMESLGHILVAWSEVPARDLFERVAWMLARALANRLARIDALLRESRRAPSYWADDLERLADALREGAEDPLRAVPFEYKGRHGATRARQRTATAIREYGQILVHWPAMWRAASRVRERGQMLAGEGA